MTQLSNEKVSVGTRKLGKTEVRVSIPQSDIAESNVSKMALANICKVEVKTSEKFVTTVDVPTGLIQEVCKLLNEETENTAVQLALAGFLAIKKDKLTISRTKKELRIRYPKYDDRNTSKRVTLRMEKFFYTRIRESIDGNLNETVTYALLNFVKHFDPTAKIIKPIKLLGTKWCNPMQTAISHVLEGRTYDVQFEPCVGALGIFANHKVADKAVLCDFDYDKINLYTQLRDSLVPFLQKFVCMAHTDDEYRKMEEILPEFSDDFQKALGYYYMNFHADSYARLRYTPREFTLADFTNLFRISQRLQGTKLETKHILKSLPKHNIPNTLILCDPPYIETETYGKTNNITLEEHERIANLLIRSKCDFVYFCRTTAKGINKEADRNLINASLDDFFCDKNLFFIDVVINGKKSITERIITNFEFAGCTAYTKEVAFNG